VREVNQALKEKLELKEQVVPVDPLELWDPKVPKDLRVCPVLEEMLDPRVLPEKVVMLDPRVAKVTKDLQVPSVLQALKDPKEVWA
jgi:hypothetical protein